VGAATEKAAMTTERLLTSPGAHSEVPLSAVDEMVDWLADRLSRAQGTT
jgi:hypothetical protein